LEGSLDEEVEQALQSLPPQQKLAVILADLEGMLGVIRTFGVLVGAIVVMAGPPTFAVGEANSFEHVHVLAMDAEGRSRFLAAYTGLFQGGYGGRSWQKVTLSAKHSHLDVMAIDPYPRELRTIYMGTTEAGLFKSTDDGETWKPVRKALKNLAAMAVNPKRPREVCASATDGVIFKSTDGGT